MKILHINKSDIRGGAAIAAYRLHTSLVEYGLDSKILVERKYSSDKNVIRPSSFLSQIKLKLQEMLEKYVNKFYKVDSLTPFSSNLFTFNTILKHIEREKPDIVHFHWIGGNMIAINHIHKIKQPIVWSLHDMWAFTGGCHYDEECMGYKLNCGNCKVLCSDKKNDLSKKIWIKKQKAFSLKKDIVIVGLSNWINECSKSSTLFKDKIHVNLPNPIDASRFKSIDKKLSRNIWNLPKNKKLVLFGAMGATSDPRKGFIELSASLAHLKKSNDIELVVFGSDRPDKEPDFGFETHYLGNLTDDISLITLYNAVDVMVVPSLQENLSNMIVESLSCSLPVVAFDIGGNSDIIIHQENGYLAKPYLSTDMALGIEWILKNDKYKDLCENARKKVLEEFSKEVVVKKYVNLYNEVLNG